jgi:hypothetical protein
MSETFSGGCQCGAVRYRAEGPVHHASICNCRMCQKALGNLTAPFVSFEGEVRFSRGKPSYFQSSQRVKRGFCNKCGTPLTYEWMDSRPSITIGSLDQPNAVVPRVEFARDNRHPILNDYGSLVEEPLGSTDEERDLLAILRSYQHPDQDTETSPGEGRGK